MEVNHTAAALQLDRTGPHTHRGGFEDNEEDKTVAAQLSVMYNMVVLFHYYSLLLITQLKHFKQCLLLNVLLSQITKANNNVHLAKIIDISRDTNACFRNNWFKGNRGRHHKRHFFFFCRELK